MQSKSKFNGFTLVEVIVVLVLLSITGVFGSLFLVNMVRSYKWAEDNAHLAQKAQVALTRLTVELAYADKESVIIDTSDNTITYDATYPDGTTTSQNEFNRDGNELKLSVSETSYTLSDKVTIFVLDTSPHRLDVTLELTGANGVTQEFKTSIAIP